MLVALHVWIITFSGHLGHAVSLRFRRARHMVLAAAPTARYQQESPSWVSASVANRFAFCNAERGGTTTEVRQRSPSTTGPARTIANDVRIWMLAAPEAR
jgi:hypothetical protein